MSANTAESSDALDLETLAAAPVFAFLLIAAADGKIERKEMKRFSESLTREEHAILTAVMSQSGLSMEQLMAAAQKRLQDPMSELLVLAHVIDTRLGGDAAAQFKAALLSLAQSVAQVSGGLFGRFTGKPGKTESAMLALLAGTLGSTERDAGSEQPGSDSNPHSPLTDELFPALKPADWVAQAKGQVAMQSVHLDGEIQTDEPVIGYVQDRPQTLEFVPAGDITDTVPLAGIHARAMGNLDRRLADKTQWHELKFDAGVEGLGPIHGLALIGDYFASEGILSEAMLRQAHERLDAALLMAIVPQRGELFVTNLISEGSPEPERIMFAHFAIKKFFNPEQAPISPFVFIIRNGKIVGTIQGMDGIIEDAREAAEAETRHEDSLLKHSATINGTEEAFGLQVEVTALCVDTMDKNLQHVLRAYIHKLKDDARFTGAVDVAVTVQDPACEADDRQRVSDNLANLAQFLTDQFASMNVKAEDGSPIVLRCELGGAAAA